MRLFLALLAVLCFAVVVPSASALDIETDFQPPPGEVGTEYEFEFEAEEGCVPYRFSFLNGTVPPGLEITTDGKLTGTPTEAGKFTFWVGLDDNSGPSNPYCLIPSMQSQGEFTMVVLPDLAVTTKTLPNGAPGVPYSAQLEFSNSEVGWPVTWTITSGSLPGGLTLSSGGLVSGTPTGVDSKTFTVRASEQFRRWGEQELTLTVGTSLQAAGSFGPGEVGLRYSASVKGTGGIAPLSYAAQGTLPPGVTLDTKTGVLSGTPTDRGVYGFKVVVSDAAKQQTTVPAVVRIVAHVSVSTTRLPFAHVGSAYGAQLRAKGGLAPRTWRLRRGYLPRGLRLDRRTGTILGVPRATGRHRLTVEARDRLGAAATKALDLFVK